MKPRTRRLLLGGLVTAAAAVGVSWLLTNERSPLDEYLLWNPGIRNFWGLLNFPSYLAGSIAAGNPHNVNEPVAWTAFFLQWLLIGIFITAIAGMFRRTTTR